MVALRELVQNTHDSILRLRMEQPDWQGESRIQVHADSVQGIVRIIDTGAGLTQQEIHNYLATVDAGLPPWAASARARRQWPHRHVRAGVFSAFVLAWQVTVRTRSCQTPAPGLLHLQQCRALHGQPDPGACPDGHRSGTGTLHNG